MKDLWNINHYQKKAIETAIYPDSHKIVYPALGLAGEAGEVANKVKKFVRDKPKRASSRRKSNLQVRLATCYGTVQCWHTTSGTTCST